ncbi:MAG TPA: hypothetical protein VMZ00_03710, partial [Sporichthya sp.]|nr:hypothetical protein [Sporichthya sp.]
LTLAAAVPAYSAVSGALTSDHIDGVAADTTAGPGAAAAAGNAAPTGPVAVSGDTGELVRTLPPPPTAAPTVPAPLTQHQEREVRRQAKWEAKLARAAAAVGDGK